MGTCLRIIRGPMISMKIRFPLERSRRERQSLSPARSSGGSRSVRIKKMQITTLYLKDMTGTLKVIWFRMPFLRNTLGRGGVITLRGRIVRKKDALVMEHPEIFYPSAS